jgi:hypothetical protein
MPGFVIRSGMIRWSTSISAIATNAARKTASTAACATASPSAGAWRLATRRNDAAVHASTSG